MATTILRGATMTITYWQTVLEILPEVKDQGLKKYETYPHTAEGWQYLLNYLTANTLRSWFSTELGGNPIISPATSWQFTNGIAIELQGIRYVIIPDESIDQASLNVPREWLEIENWAGDFYLAATVDLDHNIVELWGFTDFNTVKSAPIDFQDHNYQVDRDQINCNPNLLLTQRHFNLPVGTKLVNPIASIDPERAKNLTDRLGSPAVILPRLALPFANWLALCHHPKALKNLSLLRQGKSIKSVINLGDWLANLFPEQWKEPSFAYAYALRGEEEKISRVRRLIIPDGDNVVEFYLVLSLIKSSTDRVSILFQLFPLDVETLPVLQIRIMDGDNNLIQESMTNGTEAMLKMRRFSGNIGDEFIFTLMIKDYEFIEEFVI